MTNARFEFPESDFPEPGIPGLPGSTDAPLRVRDPGELAAAVPALLGFVPHESLVLVGTGGESGRRLTLTLRVDLPPPADPDAVRAVAAAAAQALLRSGPAGAAVLVVGGDPAQSSTGPPREDMARAAVAALADVGVRAHTVTWAASIAPGARWACYPVHGCGCAGVLRDPRSSVVAATAALRGMVVYASREELARQVAPAPIRLLPATPGAVSAPDSSGETPEAPHRTASDTAGGAAPVGAGVGSAAAGDCVSAGETGSCTAFPGARPGDDFAVLRQALEDAVAGSLQVDARRVARLAAALRLPAVRDVALAACDGPIAPAAEQLWAVLARHTPGRDAATPAALLAVAALRRGDGALASIALERAHQACPEHRFAAMLRAGLDAGMGPEDVREWLRGVTGTRAGSGPDAAVRPGGGLG